MSKTIATFAALLVTTSFPVFSQPADTGDVRLPIRELLKFVATTETKNDTGIESQQPSVLLAAHLMVSEEAMTPTFHATFRVMSFGDSPSTVALFSGDLSVLRIDPGSEVLVRSDEQTCLVTRRPGIHEVTVELLPSFPDKGTLGLPQCPSRIVEGGTFAQAGGIRLSAGDARYLLRTGERTALPMTLLPISWELLTEEETSKAPAVPKASEWNWTHEILVLPQDDHLQYRSQTRAIATDGSGLDGKLQLPSGAFDVQVSSPDLRTSHTVPNEEGQTVLEIHWKTEGVRDRRMEIRYKLAASILDKQWKLAAPDGSTKRFLLVAHPQLEYSGPAVEVAVPPQGLPSAWMEELAGRGIHPLAAAEPPSVSIQTKPVAETDAGVISSANWDLRVEPDGAMILVGTLTVSHKAPFDLVCHPPAGMKLLTSEVDQKPQAPTRDAQGRMNLHLAGAGDARKILLSFTDRRPELDPLEGIIDFTLPVFPAFIATLDWSIRLPDGYQAETSGNAARIASPAKPSTILMRKNLCRGDQPTARLFYQHANTNR